ncbi:Flp pilus assembly protein protease CpaA [Anaerobacterium chartisolvens]|uniref:Flp pilus assembly protein protease CpaA n=1 Tax=Anaerobacterium chartisolvens TaxID=1297424 RepID=A0A369AM17_9FIRM|nr:prepilin peptidase [Anaerobacterium chartisolvens]RCX10420.1 Flp pilus assembly protein protease CpaA [Anaerobacterium chartisolvens]
MQMELIWGIVLSPNKDMLRVLYLAAQFLYIFQNVFLIFAAMVAAAIDLKTRTIPDKLNIFLAAVGLVFTGLSCVISYMAGAGITGVYDKALGVVAAGLPLYIAAFATNGGIGGGDIKFMAAAGLFLGWKKALAALFISFAGAAVVLVLLIAFKVWRKDTPVPLGPFFLIGILTSVLLL